MSSSSDLILKERRVGSTLWQRLLAVHQKCKSFSPEYLGDYISRPSLQLDVAGDSLMECE